MSLYRQIYLDTNVLITLKEGLGSASSLLQDILASLESAPNPVFSTSILAFSELLVKPYRERNEDLISTYRSWSHGTRWLGVSPITSEILDIAAVLRSGNGRLKLPDAIHVASAIGLNCSHLLTADMGLKTMETVEHPVHGRLPIAPLVVIRPDETTLSSILKSLAA